MKPKNKAISAMVAVTVALSILVAFSAIASAADINVPADYTTIQAAIGNATSGDTINVAAGTYDEQVVIDKALTLQGVGDTTIISPSQTTASGFQLFTRYGGGSTAGIIVANAGGASVTVKDLKVDGELVTSTPGSARLIGIFYRETGGTIDNVTVEDVTVETGNGAYLSAETQTVSVEVKNSTFTNYQKNGIDANGGTLTANIHDNTVTGRGPLSTGDHCQNGIVLQFSEGTITGNKVSDHFYTPATWHAVGIYLNECNSSTVSGNTLTNNQEGVALDYYTDGSGSGVTIDVNGGSITGGTYGIKIGGDSTLGSDLTCNVGNTAAVTIDGTSGIGIYVTRNVNLTISNSTIKNTASGGYGGVYIYLGECPVTIDSNTIQSNGGSGIYVAYVQGLVAIYRNTIQSNEDYGIMSYGLGAATPNTLTVTHNSITGSPTGIGSQLSTTAAHCNSIHGNTDYGVVNWDATVLDAEYNWWGDATGPAGAGSGSGDAVSTNVDYDPWLTAAPPCEVESSDDTGATWNTFQVGDSVYIYGSGYPASTSYNIYVVADTTWSSAMPIPAREAGTATTVYTDSTGAIAYSDMEGSGTSPALIWASAVYGDYDIVVDVNGNGNYDSCMDALNDKDVGDAGFVVRTSPPEVPAITPLGFVLVMISLFGLVVFATRAVNKR